MPRRRPNRITSPTAGTVKALPSGLAQAAGQIRTAEQIAALTQQQTLGLATPLPRDTFPYAFGPGIPLTPAPLDPGRADTGRAEPRIWDYPTSWNLPGVGTNRLVPWRILRDAALLPIIRDCIRIRKQEIADLDWDITLSRRAVEAEQRANPGTSRVDVEAQLRDRLAPDIARAVDFWQLPDRGNGYTFTEWITQALEEHLVLDALAIYPRRTLGGDLYALEVLDGSTIKPLLDHRGGRPQPPQPAYQQQLHGFPRGEFTADVSDTGDTIPDGYAADQLIYIRREVRTHTPYGLSPVEQALADVDLWMKRVAWMRAEYTDGVMPAGWLRNEQGSAAGQWSPSQIAEYERELNDYYSGNTANRMRWRVLPPGLVPEQGGDAEPERYKPDYDLHLLKLVVAHFDLTVHELGFTEAKGLGSSGHAEGQSELNERKGRGPTLKWLAAIFTDISRAHLALPAELEFRWVGLDDDGAADEQTIAQVAAGLLTLNEGRDEIGRPRFAFLEADKPALFTATGTIEFVEGASEPKPVPPGLAPFTGQPGPQAGNPQAPGELDDQTDGEDTTAAAAKVAEAAAYRRWARRADTGGRRFQLKVIASPSDLATYRIDPGRVTFLGKAGGPDGPKIRPSPTTGRPSSAPRWRERSTSTRSPTTG